MKSSKTNQKVTHTPGEWYPVDTAKVGEGLDSIILAAGKDGVYVAEVFGKTREQAVANTKLIEMCPQMLDLIKMAFYDSSIKLPFHLKSKIKWVLSYLGEND